MRSYFEVAASTLIIYLFLIVMIRLFARRQLGQLSVLDFLVIILLGSAVETAMIHGDTRLRAGLLSVSVLLAANFVLTKLMVGSRRFRHLLGSGPVLLVRNGKLIKAT